MKRKAIEDLPGRASKAPRLEDDDGKKPQANAKQFECPICYLIAMDAVVTTCCEQVFCRRCLETWVRQTPNCPMCKSTDAEHEDSWVDLAAQKLSRRCYDELVVSCNSCSDWKGSMSDFQLHATKKCKQRLVECPLCDVEIKAADLEQHECPMTPTVCDCCHSAVPRIFLSGKDVRVSHKRADGCQQAIVCTECRQTMPRALACLHECPSEKISCGLCSAKVQRSTLSTHDLEKQHSSEARKLVQENQELKATLARMTVQCIVFAHDDEQGKRIDCPIQTPIKNWLQDQKIDPSTVDVWINRHLVQDIQQTLGQARARSNGTIRIVARPRPRPLQQDASVPSSSSDEASALRSGRGLRSGLGLVFVFRDKHGVAERVQTMSNVDLDTATPRYLLDTLQAMEESTNCTRFLLHKDKRIDTSNDVTLASLGLASHVVDSVLQLTVRERLGHCVAQGTA